LRAGTRDITPANIVICRGGASCLVDFALATSFAEIRPEFTHHTEIVGTLAYLAPEQTGRTGRSVDQRADLYALGATLYELATGGPQFGSGDPLRLALDHLARVPVPPAEVNQRTDYRRTTCAPACWRARDVSTNPRDPPKPGVVTRGVRGLPATRGRRPRGPGRRGPHPRRPLALAP
jgi:serine/threonine protein kinase